MSKHPTLQARAANSSLHAVCTCALLLAAACGTETGGGGGDDPDKDVAAADADAAETTAAGDAGCTSAAQCPTPKDPCNAAACIAGRCEVAPKTGASCDDGDSCTESDACTADGKCEGKDSRLCQCKTDADCPDDGNKCNGAPYCELSNHTCKLAASSVTVCPSTDPGPCREDVCDPATGACKVIDRADGAACNDNQPCTVKDACTKGVCDGESKCQCQSVADCPDDNNACNGVLYCDKSVLPFVCRVNPASIVQCPDLDPDPCVGSACNKTSGKCAPSPTDGPCDLDGTKCTTDACKDGSCAPVSSTCSCSKNADCEDSEDGNPCNGTLYCNVVKGNGVCELNPATVVSCPSLGNAGCIEAACEPKTGKCGLVDKADGADCHDGTPCTKDAKCKAGKCKVKVVACACNETADCKKLEKDLTNKCAGTFYCDKGAGSCKLNPSTATVCSSVNDTKCLKNTCDPKSGKCGMKPVTKATPCEDGSPCTSVDTCAGGSCGGGENGCSCAKDADCAKVNALDKCLAQHFCDAASQRCVPKPGTEVVCKDGEGTCEPQRCDPLDGKCKADPIPDGQPCGDGQLACVASTCQGGKCKAAAKPVGCACWQHSDCTAFEDGNACNGTLYCDVSGGQGLCAINPASIPICNGDAGPCKTLQCDPKDGQCKGMPAGDGGKCDDNNACTLAEACEKGDCVQPPNGATLDCDDGNGCTVNLCGEATGCSASALPGACSDGDACTTGDACNNGACAPKGKTDCDDNNPCTADGCDPSKGCVHVSQDGPCSDGDACTGNDACKHGACAAGGPIPCDDGNPCTKASCDKLKGCQFAPDNGASCNDGDLCTSDDTCSNGACGGAKVTCDDKLPCTSDLCDPGAGCVFAAKTGEKCDDGDACTTEDRCNGSACKGGPPRVCDDGNPCTNDGCDKATGCFATNNTSVCDDNNACTSGDLCKGGKCAPGATIQCDDSNVCTADSCDKAKGCVNLPLPGSCDDGDSCTNKDTCTGGVCKGQGQTNCDDGNGCTTDVCSAKNGCTNTPNTNSCSDNNACTGGDQCSGGSCKGGNPIQCDDQDVCTTDSCDAQTGCAHQVADGKKCDDGDPCTTKDACTADGTCDGFAVNCNDGNPCTDDACSKGTGKCAFVPNTKGCDDGNKCTLSDACADGSCKAGLPKDCDDGSTCTDDVCAKASGVCSTVPVASVNPGQCNGLSFEGKCYHVVETATSHKDAVTACFQWGGTLANVNSNEEQKALQVYVGQIARNAQATWIGGNASANSTSFAWADATTFAFINWESLYPKKIAAPTAIVMVKGSWKWRNEALTTKWAYACERQLSGPLACDDGSACTVADSCNNGKCVAGAQRSCDDGNPCTNDSCKPDYGCIATANTSDCEDGNKCTTNDKCDNSVCKPGDPIVCVDNNDCTIDTCSPSSGCVHSLHGDGTPCYRGGCVKGTCRGSLLVRTLAVSTRNTLAIDGKNQELHGMGNKQQGTLGPNPPAGNNPVSQFKLNVGTARAVAARFDIACMITLDGEPRCWGFGGGKPFDPAPPKNGADVVDLDAWSGGKMAGVYMAQRDGKVINVDSKTNTATNTGFNKNAARVAVGYDHICALAEGGQGPEVRCWGAGSKGQLGTGSKPASVAATATLPVSGQFFEPKALCAGDEYTCLATEDSVLCFGEGSKGQLGNNKTSDSAFPVFVDGGWEGGVQVVTCGSEHACAIVKGTAHCWGANDHGQLGDGTTIDRKKPVAVQKGAGDLTGVVALKAHQDRTCARLTDGTVYCWGRDNFGAFGFFEGGKEGDRYVPSKILIDKVNAIASGDGNACAIRNGGEVWCWGSNGNQLSFPFTSATVVAPTADRTVEAPIQKGTDKDATAIAVSTVHGCLINGDKAVKCWGQNKDMQVIPTASTATKFSTPFPTGVTNALRIATSKTNTCAELGNNTTQCWGDNTYSQLGTGQAGPAGTANIKPFTDQAGLAVGFGFACALGGGGDVKCWGRNHKGQLGVGDTNDRPFPTTVVTTKKFKALAAGSNHMCGLQVGGKVSCWGARSLTSSDQNLLGDRQGKDSSTPVDVADLSGATQIALSANHACAIFGASENLKCWGYDSSSNGHLGNGSGFVGTAKQPFTALAIGGAPLAGVKGVSAGGSIHTCVRFADGTARCFGRDNFGQLGTGYALYRLPIQLMKIPIP